MFNKFKAISFSFERVPLELRESLALDATAIRGLLRYCKEFTTLQDVLILSTCNRTEVYYSSDADMSLEIIKLLGVEKKIPDPGSLIKHCDVFNDHKEAVNRLFEVSIGLHSKILGDQQITHQAKTAYQMSVEEDMAGPFLHRLLHAIFFSNKRVVRETAFRDGAASVSYAALELVEELTAQVPEPKILIVGLGEIGTDVCRHFAKMSFKNGVFISNRTIAKAKTLAAECGFKVIKLNQILSKLSDVDVVISSLSVNQPFITKSVIEKQKILSFKYFIDLSVPRSIEPDIEKIPGIIVYNIDDIQTKTTQSLQKRLASIPQVREILSESIADFNQWSKEMAISPILNNLKNALEKIRQQEISKTIKKGNNINLDTIEEITRNMIQRIIKQPAITLKSACKRDQADSLVEGLNDLFDLEKESDRSNL